MTMSLKAGTKQPARSQLGGPPQSTSPGQHPDGCPTWGLDVAWQPEKRFEPHRVDWCALPTWSARPQSPKYQARWPWARSPCWHFFSTSSRCWEPPALTGCFQDDPQWCPSGAQSALEDLQVGTWSATCRWSRPLTIAEKQWDHVELLQEDKLEAWSQLIVPCVATWMLQQVPVDVTSVGPKVLTKSIGGTHPEQHLQSTATKLPKWN